MVHMAKLLRTTVADYKAWSRTLLAKFVMLTDTQSALTQARAMGGLDVLVNSGKFIYYFIVNLQLQQCQGVAAFKLTFYDQLASSE